MNYIVKIITKDNTIIYTDIEAEDEGMAEIIATRRFILDYSVIETFDITNIIVEEL